MDRSIIQVQPVRELKGLDPKDYQEKFAAEFKEYARRVNEALRRLNEQILKLEGRSGVSTIKDAVSIVATNPTLLDFNSHGAITQVEDTQPRTIELAAGAHRDTDGQWIADDSGAVILQLCSDGKLRTYANTGLTPKAAFTPTLVLTTP